MPLCATELSMFLAGAVIWRADCGGGGGGGSGGGGGAVFEMLVGLLEVCQTGEECRKRAGACVSVSDVWRA